MTEGSVARRYARALLDLAREGGLLDRVDTDLGRFVATTAGDFGVVLSNPVFTHSERRSVLESVLPRLDLDPLTVTFLRLVLDKDRMGAIADIHRAYQGLADVEANRVRATVTTSAAIDSATEKAVVDALSAATGKTVVVTTKVDPSLLGGMVAQVGSRVYDASLRSRLEQLQLSLAAPARA